MRVKQRASVIDNTNLLYLCVIREDTMPNIVSKLSVIPIGDWRRINRVVVAIVIPVEEIVSEVEAVLT